MLEYPKGVSTQCDNLALEGNQQERITMEELHWLAGIWEGEGTVTVYNQIDKRTKRNHLLPLVCYDIVLR